VDDEKRQRRLQFSLSKLMLWMVVWAIYLSVMRFAGAGTADTAFFGLWLGAIVVIRLTLGVDLGFPGFVDALLQTKTPKDH
jgi:hypothetical protein